MGMNPEIIHENLDYSKKYTFQPNTCYLVGNYSYLYSNIDLTSLFVKDRVNGYLIDQDQTKDLLLAIYFSQQNNDTSIDKLLEICNVHDKIVGFNEKQFSQNDLIHLYYHLGKHNVDKRFFGLSFFYDDYLPSNSSKTSYNKDLFILTRSYWHGTLYNPD